MIRFGLVCELGKDENAGYARVHFDDVDIVSDWLALPSVATKTAKQWIPIEVNSQVGCLIDNDTQQGFIAVVFWSDTNTPPAWANENTMGMLFADGSEFYYDSDAHTLMVNAPESELNIECKKLNITGEVNIKGETKIEGDTSVTGQITASDEVTAGQLQIKLTQHKHPTPAGVSGPPTP
jgi:phage baseplate assembly protein V